MKVKYVIGLCILIGLVFVYGCNQNVEEITHIEGLDNTENSPSISNVKNSFAISVNAKVFNSALEYSITFDKMDFDLALNVENLKAGDVSIQVFNDTKQMLYKLDINQKTSLAQTIELEEKPTKIKFIFNTVTATFNCSILAK